LIPQTGDRTIGYSGVPVLSPFSYASEWAIVQRLFSTFADGWPGVGLLLLRLVTAAALIFLGIDGIHDGTPPLAAALHFIGIAAAIFLLMGFLTPVAGALAALAKVAIAAARFASFAPGDPWIALGQAILAAALAMLGPGEWSIDARRFGRKHIHLSDD
jgi:putative oxidoreductase